ncbi:MAG: hypothetical protein NTW06_00905, partial [Candidatus Falkowbacteria bacterium]|nr:hypothetical protein [Candidatus Falkowbacteria bacterium]
RITNLAAPTANNDAVTKQYVDNGGTKDNSGNQIKIVCGQAPPTWTDAIGYTNSAAITIDTTIGGVPAFSTTPIYFTSISCNSACWRSTGYNAVYNSSPSSFQIFVQNVGDPIYLNGASAIANNWIIRWCGMGR